MANNATITQQRRLNRAISGYPAHLVALIQANPQLAEIYRTHTDGKGNRGEIRTPSGTGPRRKK